MHGLVGGDYVDGFYTSASPLNLTSGVKVTLQNHALTKIVSQVPIDIDSLYKASNFKIIGRNGDGLNITIEFKCKPTTGAVTKIATSIDIGGAIGEIYPRDFILTKGNGVEHYFISSVSAYTLNTWEANGGLVKVVSDADVSIYDIRYVITRTHKAR